MENLGMEKFCAKMVPKNLFSTMKNHLKGSHFEIVEEIQKVTTTVLNKLQENDLWKCFDSWNSRTAAGRRSYFKGDHCSAE
jgi:hypothetical protein